MTGVAEVLANLPHTASLITRQRGAFPECERAEIGAFRFAPREKDHAPGNLILLALPFACIHEWRAQQWAR